MSKRLSAKTGEYQNQQNETKGEYTQVGVILQNENGEYLLLDPTVSLAGILVKQNALAMKQNKPQRDNVMCGIYEETNNTQQNNNQQQQNNNEGQQQGQYQQQNNNQGYQQR
ncbi:MAG: hypothetical protein QM500_14420 [Methylococcales bacterium]